MGFFQEINSFNIKNKKIQHLLILSKFIKSKKLYLKILEKETELIKILFKIILKYYYMKGYIEISKNSEKNIKKLEEIISKDFKLKKDFKNILKFISIEKIHKSSAMEVMKKNKIMIIDKRGKSKSFKIIDLTNLLKQINKIKNEINKTIIRDNYKKV